MSIDELTAVVEPPRKALEAGPLKRWRIIQAQVGTKLPTDFRDFGRTFGTGKFLEQGVSVFNPFAAVFPQWLDEGLAVWRSLRSAEGDAEVPYPVFPETPGLLTWGTDEGGSGLFWLTEGKPNEWPIIVRGETPVFHRFQMNLTTFLARLFAEEIVLSDVWQESTFKTPAKHIFTPLEIKPRETHVRKNIFELYMENGMRAGFWITHLNWEGTGDAILVKSVNGQTEGPLTDEPPSYGNGLVLIDVFVHASLRKESVPLTIASDRGFRIVEKPDWWKE